MESFQKYIQILNTIGGNYVLSLGSLSHTGIIYAICRDLDFSYAGLSKVPVFCSPAIKRQNRQSMLNLGRPVPF